MENRPNVLLIVVEQLRRDALGLNNPAGSVHTPHLDQLARESVNFTRAYSACPTCIAARASLFTGLSPANHGFTGYAAEPVWHYENTLPAVLSQAGYHTQCVGKMHVQPARSLMGFHNVVLHDGFLHDKRRASSDPSAFDDYLPWLRARLGPEADIMDAGIGCNGYAARIWPWDERWHPTSYVVTQSIEFLRRRDPTKPFFLKTSFHRPHSPLDPPRTYWDMYENTDFPEPPVGDWADSPSPSYGAENPIPRDKTFRDRARRAYYALVSQIDYELNRLFSRMVDLGVWDDTLIVFVSDHGDMLYDHHMVRKSVPMEGSAGIPLFMRFPRGAREGRVGTANHRLAELRDLFPTICAACNVPTPDGLDGLDLFAEVFPREVLHGEHPCGDWSNQWLTDGREKYIWLSGSGRELLFDLESDPAECRDLAAGRPERTAFWRARLAQTLEGRLEGYAENNRLIPGRNPSSAQPWAGYGQGHDT